MNKLPKEFSRISEIEVPEQLFNPISTGVPELDKSFSEISGLIPSQVMMVTGNPGSGKTTICAYAGAKITERYENPAVFLSYEMSDFQLKLQADKIPGFSNMVVSTYEFYKDANGLDSLFNALDMIQPSVVIADSLQKMASRMPEGPKRGQIVLVERFTQWAKKSFVPVLLIGHNEKSGNYAGPAFLEHEVDSHLKVKFDRESGERFFSMSKNRFGGNTDSYGFRISNEGVHIRNNWEIGAEDDIDLLTAVTNFKSGFSKKGFRIMAEKLIGHLNLKYAEEFEDNTQVGEPSKVKIAWNPKYSYCDSKRGKIVLTDSIFDKWETVAYTTERKYMNKFATTRETVAIWKVIHEWSHLFDGHERHSGKLWKKISNIAEGELWLWE